MLRCGPLSGIDSESVNRSIEIHSVAHTSWVASGLSSFSLPICEAPG